MGAIRMHTYHWGKGTDLNRHGPLSSVLRIDVWVQGVGEWFRLGAYRISVVGEWFRLGAYRISWTLAAAGAR